MILARAPELDVEGEMRGDTALSKTVRQQVLPGFAAQGGREPPDHAERRRGEHHLQRAAHDGGGGVTVGGLLLGVAKPVHILTPSSTVRRIVNMTAVAVADAVAQGKPA